MCQAMGHRNEKIPSLAMKSRSPQWNVSFGVPVVAHQVKNLTSIYEDAISIPGLAQWVEDLSFLWAVVLVWDVAWIPSLLWLWYRPAAAALIWPLAWELPYALGAALKATKKFFFSIQYTRCYTLFHRKGQAPFHKNKISSTNNQSSHDRNGEVSSRKEQTDNLEVELKTLIMISPIDWMFVFPLT